MQLEITKDQYEALLKLVFLGGLLANPECEKKGLKGAKQVHQYLFSKADDFGLGSMVEYNAKYGKFDLVMEEAMNLEQYIDYYLYLLSGNKSVEDKEVGCDI